MALDFSRIHRYTFDDLNILLDINSGSVHVCDDMTMVYLDFLENHSQEEAYAELISCYGAETAAEIEESLQSLIDEGYLFSDLEQIDTYKPHDEPLVKAMCLHMAHDCNLRCGYCFADSGAYGGSRGLMTEEVGKKALELLMQTSAHRQHVEVDYFGGEPLLNFKVIQKLTAYGYELAASHGKQIKFTLTTNGVNLNDEIIQWMNANDVDAVLSLDGRKKIHDDMRPFASGKPSYDVVVGKFQQLAKSRGQQNYYLRGTYTHNNPDFAQDAIHMADDLGFKELSLEPVVGPQTAWWSLKEEDKPTLLANYDALTRHYLAREEAGDGYNFFHFNIDFDGGPCLPKRLSGCGAGHDYLAVSPEGDLYPCHQFVGEEAYKMGDVFTGIEKPEIGETFQEAYVVKKPLCLTCWARFYCSGGCHANNIRYGGGILSPYEYGCDLQRKRIECGIYLGCKRLLRNMDAL